MDIEAIVFDFDGVLAESVSVKGEAFYDLYADYGSDTQQKVLDHHLAHGGVSRFEKIKHYDVEFLGLEEPDQKRIDEMAGRFSNLVEEKVVASDWVRGAKDFLEKYFQEVPIFVASATPQAELERILERRGMTPYFQAIFGSPTKKDEHLRFIAREYDCDLKKMVMIGDTMSDYRASQLAGTQFVGRKLNDGFPDDVVVVDDLETLGNALGL